MSTTMSDADASLLAALDANAQSLTTDAAQRIRELLAQLGQARASLSTAEWFKRMPQQPQQQPQQPKQS